MDGEKRMEIEVRGRARGSKRVLLDRILVCYEIF